MIFSLSIDVMAHQDVNDILSRHRSESASIRSAFRSIVADLKRDAISSGKPIRGTSNVRKLARAPLEAIFLVDGQKVRIRAFRYRTK